MRVDKWKKLRKQERNEAVARCKKLHPEMTFIEIGKIFKISGQRVGDIVKKYILC